MRINWPWDHKVRDGCDNDGNVIVSRQMGILTTENVVFRFDVTVPERNIPS